MKTILLQRLSSKTAWKSFIKFRLRNKGDAFEWILAAVYGAAQPESKREFLIELGHACKKETLPMLIGGDFNIIHRADDKNNDIF